MKCRMKVNFNYVIHLSVFVNQLFAVKNNWFFYFLDNESINIQSLIESSIKELLSPF